MKKIRCPHCKNSINIQTSVSVFYGTGKILKARDCTDISKTHTTHNKLTSADRRKIIWNHNKNWRDISKAALALKLGLSTSQINGVCAWQHPNLKRRMVCL
jgi:hypothetical protein